MQNQGHIQPHGLQHTMHCRLLCCFHVHAGIQVKDRSYRKALELRPDQFMLDFALAEHNLLPQIKQLACPDDAGLTAKLYKLNIHR